MSDVERLESELALAKACEVLEDARAAFHADRTDAGAIKAYRKAERKVADIRVAHRARFKAQVGPGDAAPQVDTVQVKARADR